MTLQQRKSDVAMLSVVTLVAANLVPAAGALFLGWDAAIILLLYWAENLVTGFYTVLKMALVKVTPPIAHLGKLFMIPFFCVHFGGFCAGHGFFLFMFFKLRGGDETPSGLFSILLQLWQNRPPGLEWPVLALFISHGVSFVQNFFLKGEYASGRIEKLMAQPYGRIVLLHVAIIFGGMLVLALGSPVALLLVLVAFKIVMDIGLHIKSHRHPSPGPAPDAAAKGEPLLR